MTAPLLACVFPQICLVFTFHHRARRPYQDVLAALLRWLWFIQTHFHYTSLKLNHLHDRYSSSILKCLVWFWIISLLSNTLNPICTEYFYINDKILDFNCNSCFSSWLRSEDVHLSWSDTDQRSVHPALMQTRGLFILLWYRPSCLYTDLIQTFILIYNPLSTAFKKGSGHLSCRFLRVKCKSCHHY